MTTTDRAALERELAELGAANAAADGWGAALGLRHERMVEIQAELRRLDAKPAEAEPFDAVTLIMTTIAERLETKWFDDKGDDVPGAIIDLSGIETALAPILQRVREEAAAAEREAAGALLQDALRAAVTAVEPLEALNMVGPKGVAPELWVGIQNGITAVRALVTRPGIAAAIRARGTGEGK